MVISWHNNFFIPPQFVCQRWVDFSGQSSYLNSSERNLTDNFKPLLIIYVQCSACFLWWRLGSFGAFTGQTNVTKFLILQIIIVTCVKMTAILIKTFWRSPHPADPSPNVPVHNSRNSSTCQTSHWMICPSDAVPLFQWISRV